MPATVPESNGEKCRSRYTQSKLSQNHNGQDAARLPQAELSPSSRPRCQYSEGPREHSSSTTAVYPGSGTQLFNSRPTKKNFQFDFLIPLSHLYPDSKACLFQCCSIFSATALVSFSKLCFHPDCYVPLQGGEKQGWCREGAAMQQGRLGY